ncbi:MAG: stage II sporulation protein R [Oscillospiraceae bacterium]|jgi:stage II sporulation protein R|nr:stage II sporulation protein R [Oscillospiraceae bacterium]
MRKFEIAVVIGIAAAIFCGNISEFADCIDGLEENVLRLHILANSDSAEDQALKLKVRDALLEQSEALFSGCDTPEEIRERAVEEQETIRLLAQAVVEENGSDDIVNVQLVQMEFDDKQYEEITMPAGTYDALRILIGEAEGQNWWCVMYPPLCIPAAAGVTADADAAEVFFDSETVEILENPPKYEVKFKCLELWKELKEFFAA